MNISKFFTSVFFIVIFSSIVLAEDGVIKFATLAPEGSAWMKVMREWNQELSEKSGGKLKFKIYSGGVSGDEKDVIRKIRLGQLQAGGFTGVGLGEIAPEARILDAPFLFKNYEEVDTLYQKFGAEFRSMFEKKGYVLLGWTEVGFIYFFTEEPVQNFSELKKIRMWVWEGDPIAGSVYKALELSPISLSITDVMTSLQTNLIGGVYCSPLAVIALQWFTRTKYMIDYRLANVSGAVLVSKKAFDKLSPNLQALLLETGEKYLTRLNAISRAENQNSIETLKKNGIKIVAIPPHLNSQYELLGQKARALLVGKLYSFELLKKIEKSLEEYRKK